MRSVPNVSRRCISRGSVILARVPFEDGSGSKVRPVIVLAGDRLRVEVLPLTTVWRRAEDVSSVILRDWRDAGLRAPSIAIGHRRVELPGEALVEYRGRLSEHDEAGVAERLAELEARRS